MKTLIEQFVFVTDRNAGTKITHGQFCGFFPAGATCSTDCRQIWYVGGNQKSPMPCQITDRSLHNSIIWGFLTQKLQKSQILQTYSPRRGESLNRYSKFISFMRLWGLRKCFKFGIIQCLTEGVIGRKPQSGNFPLAPKLLVGHKKSR